MKPELAQVKAVEDLFQLLEYDRTIKNKDLSFNLWFSGYKKDYYLEYLEEVRDTYYVVKAVIIQNDKPKNKYSLIICGKHLFPERVVQVTKSYGVSVNSDNGFLQIEFSVKDAPNVDILKGYYSKNRDKILKPTLNELSNTKSQLENAKIRLQSIEFEIEYIKWKLERYKRHYSRGTETDHYKNLLSKLKLLQEKA